MKYYKRYGTDAKHEISYDEALSTLLGTYKNNDMTRDMLTLPNTILCRLSTVYVEDEASEYARYGQTLVNIAGLYNELPMGVEYDENGNRI